MPAHRFDTTIGRGGAGDGSTAFLEVPGEVVAALGRGKRPPVRVTINDYSYRSTVAIYDGKFYLPVRREVRAAAGVTQGDPVAVAIELDEAPREVELPADLAAAFAAAPEANALFDTLSYSNRKEYVDWVEGAKRTETRARRVGQSIEMLRAGTRTPKA